MDNVFDRMFYTEGELIAGVDESGVSDIAGPLIAACVILPKLDPHTDDIRIFSISDSKSTPEKFRKEYAEIIWQAAIAIGIGEVQPAEIDYFTKQAALSLAMARAVASCKTIAKAKPVKPDFLIVDGHVPAPVDIRQAVIREADLKSLCTAAASIVAKVYRDDIMTKLHERYPYYNWASNKGYPCAEHFEGLDSHGVQIGVHRLRYWPFVINPAYVENMAQWETRRKVWMRNTSSCLGKEADQQLWTSKPPFKKLFSDSSETQPRVAKPGKSLKLSRREYRRKQTQESSASCIGTSPKS